MVVALWPWCFARVGPFSPCAFCWCQVKDRRGIVANKSVGIAAVGTVVSPRFRQVAREAPGANRHEIMLHAFSSRLHQRVPYAFLRCGRESILHRTSLGPE